MAARPVEPSADLSGTSRPRRRRRGRHRRRRRRPRAGHAARRLPRRPVPDAGRTRRPDRVVVARSRAASCRSTGCASRRSLRRSLRRFEVRVDTRVRRRDRARARDPRRHGGWITADVRRGLRPPARARLGPQRRGVDATTASSSAACTASPSAGFFAGESMFHHARDASKVALVGLVEHAAGQRGAAAARRAVDDAAPAHRSAPIEIPRPRLPGRLDEARERGGRRRMVPDEP